MAIYEITAPNGQVLEIEGDTPPSEADLDEIFKTTKTTKGTKTPLRPTSKGIDLRPSGIANNISNRVWAAPLSVVEAIREKKPLNQAYSDVLQNNENFINNNPGLKNAIERGNTAMDLQAYTMLPEVNAVKGTGLGARLVNGALTGAEQGAVIGGLEGLNDEGLPGLAKGIASGAGFGLTLGGGIPIAGQAAKLLPMTGGFVSRTIGRLQPETIQQAIKPNSQALDLSAKQAQNLLTRTTDRVRNAYNNLLKQRGEAISTAEDNLRNLTDRVNISDIKNDITNVFNQYQGDKVNAARNLTGNLEGELNNLVESGTDSLNDMYNYINQQQKPDYYSKAKENEAYDILSRAVNKPVQWLKSQLKGVSNNRGYMKRGENIENLLDKVDDKLDLIKSGNESDYRFYNNANFGYNQTNKDASYNLARQAYDDIINNNFTNVTQDPLTRAIASAEQDYKYYLRNILENPTNADLIPQNYDKLAQSVKNLPEEIQNEYFNRFLTDTDRIYQGKNTISPIDLQKVKQQVGQMTNWADTTRPKIQNTVLEQVYGKMNKRLQDLSPELAQANKEFANIKAFQEDEGLKRILKPGDNVDSAASALKNYDATVTKGNQYRNIKELEDTLVNAGNEPFLNTIDDINAAMDLNNLRTTGDSWLANVGTALTKPGLRLARAYNRTPLPRVMYGIKNAGKRLAIPFIYNSPRLFGEVEETDF